MLVLHNAVEDGAAFHESNAGVLDQVSAVTAALEKLNIDYDVAGVKAITQLPQILEKFPHKIIFNLVEELPQSISDASYVPAVCRAYCRACTGNGTGALLLTQDKWRTKNILKGANIPCPDGVIVPVGRSLTTELAAGKYIVKPLFSDASEGIASDSVVQLPGSELQKCIERIHKLQRQPAVVEQYIEPRELNVSILPLNGKAEVIGIAEIDFSAFGRDRPKIIDYEAKWLPDSFGYNNTPRILPAKLFKDAAELVRRYALAAWEMVGCEDYARVDFRMDANEQSFVLEINANPDISPDAGFAAALAGAAISYENFVQTLLNNALIRSGC